MTDLADAVFGLQNAYTRLDKTDPYDLEARHQYYERLVFEKLKIFVAAALEDSFSNISHANDTYTISYDSKTVTVAKQTQSDHFMTQPSQLTINSITVTSSYPLYRITENLYNLHKNIEDKDNVQEDL